MAVESESDLMGFFDAGEFGTAASIQTRTEVIPSVFGIASTSYDNDRPGANSQSGTSPFLAGAADAGIQRTQFLTPFAPVSTVRPEDTLTISAGEYTGVYRIKDIQRDGALVRLILNKR